MKKKLHLFKNLIKALQNNCKSALNFYKIPDRIIDVVSQEDIKVVCKWFGPFPSLDSEIFGFPLKLN